MVWLCYLLLTAVLLAGWFVNIFGLPGLWLMVGAVGLYAWITASEGFVGTWALMTLLGLALIAEVVEFVAGSAGAKSAGGSRSAMIGAIVGGLLGGIFFSIPLPLIGTIIGVCLGSFVGAAVVELFVFQDVLKSMRVGVGAAKGRFYGMMSKLAFGAAMLILSLIAAFPIGGRYVAAPTAGVLPASTPSTSTVPSQ